MNPSRSSSSGSFRWYRPWMCARGRRSLPTGDLPGAGDGHSAGPPPTGWQAPQRPVVAPTRGGRSCPGTMVEYDIHSARCFSGPQCQRPRSRFCGVDPPTGSPRSSVIGGTASTGPRFVDEVRKAHASVRAPERHPRRLGRVGYGRRGGSPARGAVPPVLLKPRATPLDLARKGCHDRRTRHHLPSRPGHSRRPKSPDTPTLSRSGSTPCATRPRVTRGPGEPRRRFPLNDSWRFDRLRSARSLGGRHRGSRSRPREPRMCTRESRTGASTISGQRLC